MTSGTFFVFLGSFFLSFSSASGIFIIISEDGDGQGCDFDAPTAIRKDDGGKVAAAAAARASMRLNTALLNAQAWGLLCLP